MAKQTVGKPSGKSHKGKPGPGGVDKDPIGPGGHEKKMPGKKPRAKA